MTMTMMVIMMVMTLMNKMLQTHHRCTIADAKPKTFSDFSNSSDSKVKVKAKVKVKVKGPNMYTNTQIQST